MPDTRELDTRIRELVARAVADAPPAPELDPVIELRRDHRPWWIGGGIAVATAAAAVAVFTFGDQDDKIATIPATEPTLVTVPATAPAATELATVPPTAPVTVGPLPTTPPAIDAAVVTAGPEGIQRWVDGEPTTITSEPMAFAIDLGDGRVLGAGRFDGPAGRVIDDFPDEYSAPVVIAADGAITNLFDTADWDGRVTVHDVENVGGRLLMLFSLSVGMDNPDTANETLYVVDLETQDRTEIAQIGGWEFGTSRLHLATTGLIVGESNSGPSHGLEIRVVPGSPADDGDVPTAESLGVPADGFGDCSNCPRSFTITPDGGTILWVDPVDDFSAYELVTRRLSDFDEERVTLHADVPGNLIDDVDVGADDLLLSFWDGGTGRVPPPARVPRATPGDTPELLAGHGATSGPAG